MISNIKLGTAAEGMTMPRKFVILLANLLRAVLPVKTYNLAAKTGE